MKAELNVVKFNVADVVTTSTEEYDPLKCKTPGMPVEEADE